MTQANHEYIGGNAEEAINYLGEAGVKVLRDSSQEIAGSFNLIGRDDRSSERAGVDLQLSGHTHAGQLFPIQFMTRRIFEDDWGLLRKGNFQLIVSSGYGTWGPPIRLGNTPEVVDIMIKFNNEKTPQ